ncbi:MAG: enoyl-CoA hydratase/isomerase family protein [Geminicoccaceae bacterium]
MSELRVEREGPLAIVTLARAAKLNALTFAMLDGLAAAADAIEADDTCRAVILTGEGSKAFCAGADIAEWGALGSLEFGRRWIVPGHRLFDRWARLRQPVIAMLNGIAFGGGLELAATADYRIAEAHARVGLPETQVGIVPGWSGTQRLVRRAGSPAVKRLALTGEPVDAAEALRLGLIDEVVVTGDGMERARTLASTMAQRAPVALQAAKLLINAAEGEEASTAIETLAGALAAGTADAREGVSAFKEKRKPDFKGR